MTLRSPAQVLRDPQQDRHQCCRRSFFPPLMYKSARVKALRRSVVAELASLDPVTAAVLDCGPTMTPARLTANRQPAPPETDRAALMERALARVCRSWSAEEYEVLELLGLVPRRTPAVIRGLFACARSDNLGTAVAALSDLLQMPRLARRHRLEALMLLAAHEERARRRGPVRYSNDRDPGP